MKLSQSAHFVQRKGSPTRSKMDRRRNNSKEDLSLEPITILITINKNDELQPSFVDTFSKIINNNTNFDFEQCYGNIKTTTYSEFYETLRNLGNQINRAKPCKDFNERFINLKVQDKASFKKAKSYQNVRKGSVQITPKIEKKNYLFCFEAHKNSIILLIDLSPYMLLYDYSTKSFLLQNAEEITRDLFIELQRHYNQRKNGNSGPSYFISCYVFSVYSEQIEEVIRDQEVCFADGYEKKFQNRSLISDYICAYLNKSKLPHTPKKDTKPISISHFIQKILNVQQDNAGIKTIITISAFKQLDYHPYIFFNSNWYTFCFICAGELNFGSFLIDVSEIVDRFSKSPYLETKFVYKCKFLENWEKVYLIQRKGMQFKYIDSSLQKSRAIIYTSNRGEKKQSVFEDILKFNLKLNEKRRRGQGTFRSNQSMQSINRNPKVIDDYQFNIPAENIAEIMRTKYLQGWEQLSTEKYPQNTKYVFKLEFANRAGILYNATRTEDYFSVKVSSILVQNELSCPQEKIYKQRKQIAQKIKKIDLINTSNFDIVTTFKNKNTSQTESKRKQKNNYKLYLNFDSQGYQGMKMLNQILTDHEQWNCYFKVRRIYVHFTPNSHFLNDFNQLLNQVGFFLGERISNLCFMHRKEKKEKLIDNIKEREVSRWNIIFCKVSGIFRFLEFKFGFLKYTDNEIKMTIQNIENKLISKKLANGSIKLIPEDIYNYCIQKFDQPKLSKKSLPSIFEKSWRITFKNEYLCKVFKYMNNKIIKKLGYQLLKSKHTTHHYYNIISFGEKQSKRDKGLFLQISYEGTNLIQFKLEAFPSFNLVPSLANKDILMQTSNSEKNLYHFTQRSISSSSNQQLSISAASLPLPSTTSNKDVLQPKSNQNQGKYKNSFLELFQILASELKESQKRAINMVKCYTEIYDALIRKKLDEKKIGIEEQEFVWKVKEFYRFSSQNFQAQFLANLMQIKKEHYTEQIQQNPKATNRRATIKIQQNVVVSQLFQINIDQIPEPTEYLMQSPISNIKGDLTLSSKIHSDKKYTFFLMTPNRAIYLSKKQFSQKIYFRFLNNIYCNSAMIEKQETQLKAFVQKELTSRINKQLREEQYLFFYNVISEYQPDIATSLIQTRTKKEMKNKDHTALSLLRKSEKVVSSFTGVNLNCGEIFSIINKPENSNLQQRIIRVLIQFRKKFYEYLSLFFQNSKFNLQTEQYGIASQKFNEDIRKNHQTEANNRSTVPEIRVNKQHNQERAEQAYFNNYFYQKKGLFFSEQNHEKFQIKNSSDYDKFQNMVIKICTNTGIPIYQENFVSLFINKSRKQSGTEQTKQKKFNKTEIHINFFGFKTDKSSAKVRWLNQIMTQLLTECITYLKIVTITDLNDIKQMENKLSEFIARGPFEKVPDNLWNQGEIIRQIQSGHMRSLINFHQYSFKPLPLKFISKQNEMVMGSFTNNVKSNLLYLKYWLTIEITPARVLKTKLIFFKHINLLTQTILDMDQLDYSVKMTKMAEEYLAELIKYMKVRDIFKGIQQKLMFPLDPPIPLYINQPIFKKLDEEKKKSMKIKVPKKFKNRPGNHHGLELKTLQSFMHFEPPTALSSFLDLSTPLPGSLPSPLRLSLPNAVQQVPNLKNYFKLSLIYQGSINYFPKFEPSQIFTLLACCEKLNPYAIRNLENTYIFFNPELREYFIFYLEETPVIPELSVSSAFSSTSGLSEKKKNNSLTYSVYCIDNKAPFETIQKLHGGLIKKALQEVTFYKIAKILHVSHSIIDEAEEEYFKQGSKEELIFHIPHIEKKTNLNQYIKQHLQKAFYHKKTQFKSQHKKKQNETEAPETNQKEEHKHVVKKRTKKQTNHSEQCEMRCVPQTWIFNTIETRYLEQNFGKCMFLTRIMIYDFMDTCENASFWHRHIKEKDQKNNEKHYIYPFMDGSQESSSTYNEKHLLNYLQTFKEKNNGIQKSKSIQIMLSDKEYPQHRQTNEPPVQKSWHLNSQDPENYTIVKFQIFSSFGFPRLNLIKNMYKELLFFGIYDFYLENKIFKDLVSNFNVKNSSSKPKKKSMLSQMKQKSDIMQVSKITAEKQEQQLHQSLPLPLQRAFSSPMKQTIGKPGQSFIALCNHEFVNRIYLNFIEIFHTLQHQVPIKSTPCVFLYKTERKVLIQEKTPSLLSFIKLFAEDFNKNAKNDEKFALRLIVYGIHKQTSQTYFWGIEVEKGGSPERKCKFSALFEQISNQIQKQGHEFSKMGVFFCDTLHDIDSLRQSYFLKDFQISKNNGNDDNRFWQTFNRTDKLNIQFEWMKKFEEGRSFCQNQFLFRRSLLMHYEISDFQFICYTYNFKQKENLCFMEHLEEMELWFAEKHRLYTFICKLKKLELQQEPIEYEIPPFQSQKEVSSAKRIYSIERKNTNRQSMPFRSFKHTEAHEVQINLTKLVKSLAFDKTPFKNFAKSRSAIEKMYKILSTHTVPYSNYPEYKGKQKSKLAKIAKEYLSIIRHYFGIEKMQRRESVYAHDLKQLQKKSLF